MVDIKTDDVKVNVGDHDPEQGFIYTPWKVLTPSHLKTLLLGYTLPAPPLAGSPCNHSILQHAYFKEIILFRIPGVTFEVSSCTKFHIFRGQSFAPSL